MPAGRWNTWRIGRTSAVEFAALVLLSLFMALLGPFGTADTPMATRFFFWGACIIGGGIIGAVIEPPLRRIPILAARPPLFAAAQALAMTLPITLLVMLVRAPAFGAHVRLSHYLDLFPQVLLIDIGVVILAWMIRSRTRIAPTPKPAPILNPLADRLPPALARSPLIAVEAEDHYLRIHTEAGAELIHMRLADALAAVAQGDGLQVHRSWWVARHAVQAVSWNNGRGELTLANGLKAPVSRTHAKAVKATSWGA